MVNFQELSLLINLTVMHVVSIRRHNRLFGMVTNLMISLAFIQLCMIVIYNFLTYTCHYDIENTLHTVKGKLVKCRRKDNSINVALLEIPECTYNYSEYRDGLVSDDFVANR